MVYPQHDGVSQDFPYLPVQVRLAASISVARVQPRTSKGITDLLLLHLVQLNAASPSKKNSRRKSDVTTS